MVSKGKYCWGTRPSNIRRVIRYLSRVYACLYMFYAFLDVIGAGRTHRKFGGHPCCTVRYVRVVVGLCSRLM
jgi:hypothetical protein